MTIEHVLIFFIAVAGLVVANFASQRYWHEFIVNDGYAGLLYHRGKLVATLPAGRHLRLGRHYRVVLIDLRRTLLQVAGQEVLSSDNIGVKLSVVLTTQILDPVRCVQAADNHVTHLYSAAQGAIRSAVAAVTMETLLTQRVTIGAQLRDLVAAQAEAVGVQIHSAEVRDVMLPGELRRAFSEVLKARQEGQVALERARAESAALRNLANAARLLEGQPALATLRFLQTLEASDAGRTVLMNDLSGLLPALHTRGVKPSAAAPDQT